MKKLMAVISVLLAVLAVVFLASCGGGGGGDSSGPTSTGYFPMAVGNRWTWRDTYNGATQGEYTSEITRISGNVYTIKGTNSGNTDYSICDVTYPNGNSLAGISCTAYTVSGSVWGSSTFTYSPPLLLFPSKTDVGTSESRISRGTGISTIYDARGTATYTYDCSISVDITVDGHESVTVPAGTFNNALRLIDDTSETCTVSITYAGTTETFTDTYISTETEWYAYGVGSVKSVYLNSPNVIELVSYTIK